MNNLKKWLYRTFLADALVKGAYQALDGFLTQRFPKGWPRIQYAMGGWVTILGAIVSGGAILMIEVCRTLREGGQPEAALKVGLYLGTFLIGVGLFRKLLKWFRYEEAIDADGWLDDPKAKRPESLTPAERALLQGRWGEASNLAAAKVDKLMPRNGETHKPRAKQSFDL